MAMIPKQNDLLHNLNNKQIENPNRNYMGLSQIGEECVRKLQYYHYWCTKNYISARINRLFNVGHAAEHLIVKDLFDQGYMVIGQQEEIIATAGHWKGHIDGKVFKDESPMLLEMKTYNDKRFKELKKKKVKLSAPKYWGQAQAYMGYNNLKKCMFVALNKDNSEYYIEYIDFDKDEFNELKRKELEVISAEVLVPRIGNNNPTWFACKMCGEREVCFKRKDPQKSCRTCKHVDVMDGGAWYCNSRKHTLTPDEQRKACGEYDLAEMFK